jgi:uroporphyrin-III C-methyltransferase
MTGHAKPGDSGPDWRQIAATAHAAKLTLVIYMGVSSVERISSELLSGLPGSTPVAVIQHASLAAAAPCADLRGFAAELADHQLGRPQHHRRRRCGPGDTSVNWLQATQSAAAISHPRR